MTFLSGQSSSRKPDSTAFMVGDLWGHRDFKLLIGRVSKSFQGTNFIEVRTSYGTYKCFNFGSGMGRLGVQQAGSILPGQEVIIAVNGATLFGYVVSAYTAPQVDKSKHEMPTDFLLPMQLAGYDFDFSFAGQLRKEKLIKAINASHQVPVDMADGEWAMCSPFGPGVGVELFRAWLRAGQLAGVEVYGDEEPMVRLLGERLEMMTLHREYEDRRLVNTNQVVDRRVFYPEESINDAPPRRLLVEGALHGGAHDYITTAEQAPTFPGNVAPSTPVEPGRFGLLHEFRSYDGAYLLEAADSITLRKTCNIAVPEEIRHSTGTATTKAENDTDEIQQVGDESRQSLYVTQADQLFELGRVLEIVENLAWRGRNATRLNRTWGRGAVNAQVDGGAGLPSSVDTVSQAQWHVLPRAFGVLIDSRIQQKQFYVGTSVITMLPDGGIVLEDAYHSTIIMDRGNIRISAAKDLILESGRSTVVMASQDMAIKSYRHLDIVANSGSMHIKAETQLAMLGGNGGSGGVLIESRSQGVAPNGSQGINADHGGIAMLSATTISQTAHRVVITGSGEPGLPVPTSGDTPSRSGSVVIQADNTVYLRGGSGHDEQNRDYETVVGVGDAVHVAFTSRVREDNEPSAAIQTSVVGAMITRDSTVLRSVFADSVCDLGHDRTAQAIQAADIAAGQTLQSFDIATPPALKVGNLTYDMGFSFLDTADFGFDETYSFMLPEVSWQRHLPYAQGATTSTWFENPVFTGSAMDIPTAAFPGYTAWFTEPRLVRFPTSDFYDPSSGRIAESLDYSQDPVLSCDLPVETTAVLNGNYRRGSNV